MHPQAIQLVASEAEYQRACEIRKAVFIDEQGVPEAEEFDAHEQQAFHFIYWSGSVASGTARLRILDKIAKLERIAVLKDWRGSGIGRALVLELMAFAREQDIFHYRLGAQVQALDFYRKLGFKVLGDPFMDGGIPHRWMERQDQ